MSTNPITPDDPRLTAYALGELDQSAAAEVAAAVAADPELAREVAAIREASERMEAAFAGEPLPEVSEIALPGRESGGERITFPMAQPKVRRFPYYWVSGLAAAGFAVLMLVQSPESPLVSRETGVPASGAVDRESGDSMAIGLPEVATPAPAPAVLAAEAAQWEADQAQAAAQAVAARQAAQAKMAQLSTRVAAMSRAPEADFAGEGYAAIDEPGWQQVAQAPLSTFAVDVDSASYANVRRFLRDGRLPPWDAVKVEEMVNAFTYDYAGPAAGEAAPLQANLEVAAAPWAPEHRLVRVGLKAREMAAAERGAANLVFLLDVSGSMNSPRKLPLVKEAMRMLVGQLRAQDRVAIVTYAGDAGLALPSTAVAQRERILGALDALAPGGSTHGSSGIQLAYAVAEDNFVAGGVNRVILCTDGDFNVGTTGLGELEHLIETKAKSDVFLTVLGFGTGNYQDDTLATLANRGNGQHGYLDSVREARRLLVEQVNGTLATVARDVKIQVEFNPAQVQAYRLIGYNDRRLAAEEFNDDKVDAGEIGAGHTVTALYEVVPVGVARPESAAGTVDALRYQETAAHARGVGAHEMMWVKVRAQPPEGGASALFTFPVVDDGGSFEGASADFKLAAAVAAFGLRLREQPGTESYGFAQVKDWARGGLGSDPAGYRREFLELVDRAAGLAGRR